MYSVPIPIFMDRDRDVLEVIPRDPEYPEADPVLTIVRYKDFNKQSIIMNDDEVFRVLTSLGEVFGYTVMKKDD